MALKGSDGSDVKHGSNPSNIMVGIMGPTGTGKSSFIARLTGDKSIEIGHGVESATSEIGHYNYFDKSGRSVTLIDSPGFDDSREGHTDTDILKKIAGFLEMTFKEDKKLSGIIYLHRITDPKMGGVSLRNLRMFRKLCGEDALENVVVVTTRWDDVSEKDRETMEKREDELMKTPGKFFEPLIDKGGKFLRHDNTEGSARRIVETFLKKSPVALQIQLEMRDGKTLEETAAGSELAAELKKLVDKHSKEMKDLKEEMAVAIAEKDEALKKELEAERIKMQKEIAKWEEQKQALADDITAAREEAKKKQEEADRKLLQQSAEFNRKVKEAEEKAEKERFKLKAEMDNISKERATANEKLQKLEKDQVAAANRSRKEQARIQSLVETARKEKEETDRKHRDLLRSMRRQVCYWQPYSSPFRSASFTPAPIQAGVVDGVSAFVFKCRTDKSNGSVATDRVQEGSSITTWANGSHYWDFQVLIGDQSRLIWKPYHGRFDMKSTVHPVPSWDKEADNVSDTHYVARFNHLDRVYVTEVTESANGVSDVHWGTGVVVSSKSYEVLCYKDL